VVNVEAHAEIARSLGIRSVPWVRIGPFELAGVRTRDELNLWIQRASSPSGMADYFHDMLKEGELARVLAAVKAEPGRLTALLPIVANPDASINVRIGAGAVFEEWSGSDSLAALVGPLSELTAHSDARVRVDACHYLGLTRSPAALEYVQACLADAHTEVREVATDSFELLQSVVRGQSRAEPSA
jgi:hypothetical protein